MSRAATNQMSSPANKHGLVLYDYGGSPCARRVRIALMEKGLEWDTQIIDLSRLEQRNPDYLKINPNGFVPTLAHGERVIYESNVITEYLDDGFPDTPLYPEEPWELAQVKMWQSAEAAMAKDYRTLMYQRVMGPMVRLSRTLEEALAIARRSTSDPADLAWEERVWRLEVLTAEEEAEHENRLLKWLAVLEQHLDGRDFLVGNRLTQAEVSVFPRVMMYAFVGIPVTRERFPNVARWMEHLGRRPSFATTLSEQDRGLLRLSRTPVLPWLQRTLKKREPERSWSERARLVLLKQLARRVMRRREVAADAVAGRRRTIRQPRNGEIPPSRAATRAMRASSPAMRAQPLTLYDYRHSPHARRIRILMTEKGLSWQTVEVDMSRMAHKAPEYLSINPNGEIPALRHGDRVLYDSQVIAEYLEKTFAGDGCPPLYPSDAFEAAQVRMWLALEAGTHKEFRPLFYLYLIRGELRAAGVTADRVDAVVPAGVHPSHTRWLRDTIAGQPRFDTSEALAREIILKKLDVIERRLERRDHLVGDALTMADVAWFTRLDTLSALSIRLAPARYPNLLRWYGRLQQRPSVRTHPLAGTAGAAVFSGASRSA